MAYTKTTWVNDSKPAINAANLNKIEQGIADAHAVVAEPGPQGPAGPRVTLESLARLVQRALRVIRVNPERLALREIRANLVSLLKSNGTR